VDEEIATQTRIFANRLLNLEDEELRAVLGLFCNVFSKHVNPQLMRDDIEGLREELRKIRRAQSS
jgi:hypothetical protein